MKELVYLSEGKADFTPEKVSDMLEKARDFNEAHSITGVLINDTDNRFLQVIEGDSKIIDELFASIRSDERHDAVLLVHQAPIKERSFNQWSMAFKQATTDFAKLDFYKHLNPNVRNSETVPLIKQFYLSGK